MIFLIFFFTRLSWIDQFFLNRDDFKYNTFKHFITYLFWIHQSSKKLSQKIVIDFKFDLFIHNLDTNNNI